VSYRSYDCNIEIKDVVYGKSCSFKLLSGSEKAHIA